MTRWLEKVGRYYDGFARVLSYGQDLFLLLIRLYWGWQLIVAGWGKLTNVSAAARFLADLGIPWPTLNAVVSGCGELFGGAALAVGFGSRLAAAVLAINMTVAFATAHTGDARAILDEPSRFIASPPFTFLMASTIVLLFGPGLASLDSLIRAVLSRRNSIREVIAAETTLQSKGMNRRDLGRLAVAAVGGLLAGAGAALLGRGRKEAPAAVNPEAATPLPGANLAAIRELDAKGLPNFQPSLLLAEPHTCCGLNTCKGKAKDGANTCAGLGACATVKGHVCQGSNDCKGQGGCGEHPGQNTCKGKGSCAVPLKRETWTKARKHFEELMALSGQKVGGPPPNCPKT